MTFLILAIFVGLAAADVSHIVAGTERQAQILRQDQNIEPEGSYNWAYETDNGIAAGEAGEIRTVGEDTSKAVQGQASWTSPEGEKIQFAYRADENGYQAEGSHIPTPHPIPEYILRALQYIKDHPPAVAPEEAKLIK